MDQATNLSVQIFQGRGFQRGPVFLGDSASGMDRPSAGFHAGGVYATAARPEDSRDKSVR